MGLFGFKKKSDVSLDDLKKILNEDRRYFKDDIIKEKIEISQVELENKYLKEQLKSKIEDYNKVFKFLEDALKEIKRLEIEVEELKDGARSKQIHELKEFMVQHVKVLSDGSSSVDVKSKKKVEEIVLVNFDEMVKGLTSGQKDLLALLLKCDKKTSYSDVMSKFVKLGYKQGSIGGYLDKLKKKGLENFVEISKDKNKVYFKSYEDRVLPVKEKKEKVGKKKEKKIVIIDEGQGMMFNDKKQVKKKKVSPAPPSKKKKESNVKLSKLGMLKASISGKLKT